MPKKASGFDEIPPKLVKLAAPSSKTINNNISKGVFPNEAKIAQVSSLDKNTPDKNPVINYKFYNSNSVFHGTQYFK